MNFSEIFFLSAVFLALATHGLGFLFMGSSYSKIAPYVNLVFLGSIVVFMLIRDHGIDLFRKVKNHLFKQKFSSGDGVFIVPKNMKYLQVLVLGGGGGGSGGVSFSNVTETSSKKPKKRRAKRKVNKSRKRN